MQCTHSGCEIFYLECHYIFAANSAQYNQFKYQCLVIACLALYRCFHLCVSTLLIVNCPQQNHQSPEFLQISFGNFPNLWNDFTWLRWNFLFAVAIQRFSCCYVLNPVLHLSNSCINPMTGTFIAITYNPNL